MRRRGFPPRVGAPLAAALLALAAGCVSYRTIPSTDVAAGREVRVVLAEGAGADLARFVGPRAGALDGRVVGRTDTSLTLSVTAVQRTTGVEETFPGDTVPVPRAALASVQVRRLDRGRTGLLVGGIVGLSLVVSAAFGVLGDITRLGERPGGGSGQQ